MLKCLRGARPDVFLGPKHAPAQNQHMQETFLEEFIIARIHAQPVFALARIKETAFEEFLPENVLPFRCQYMSRLFAHLCENRKNSWRIIYVLVSCQGVRFGGIEFCNRFKCKFWSFNFVKEFPRFLVQKGGLCFTLKHSEFTLKLLQNTLHLATTSWHIFAEHFREWCYNNFGQDGVAVPIARLEL